MASSTLQAGRPADGRHAAPELEAALTALEGYSLDMKTNEKVINLLVHNNHRIRVLA